MCHKVKCHIVPPYILEELAKQGSISCKKTLNDTHRILDRRKEVLNNLLIRKAEEGQGKRYIYDCQNKYEQRSGLVREEGKEATDDRIVSGAYDTSGFVRDYFGKTFELNSIDGKGMDVISNVHYGFNYNNAFWDGDEMTYGDGDGKEFNNFATAIDVVAHEITHGITQFLANLEYQSQSGALNEHFSDVFGTVIKQKYLNQDISEANWLIGDAIVMEAFPGIAIRSMRAPGTANEFDIQPAHMDKYYKGTADNQGVHINSGIPNRAFYLCCMEIGIDDCALIWFETLKSLWRTANFRDMLDKILETTRLLSDAKKVCNTAGEAVRKSFSTVGLNQVVV